MGGAGKDQVQRMVQTLLNLPEKPTPPDRADALALALCHLATPVFRAVAAAGPALIGSLRARSLTGPCAATTSRVPGRGGRGRLPVIVPAGCAGRVGEMGGPAFLHVHTHVREDAMLLYGFPSRDERDCFDCCLGAWGRPAVR